MRGGWCCSHVTWPPAALPACWRGRRHAVVLHAALGDGQRLRATLACWLADGERSASLSVVVLAAELPAAAPWADAVCPQVDTLAGELARAWPLPTAGTHLLTLHSARVRVLLLVGEPARALRHLVARVDAFDLAGLPAPWHGPTLTRLAAPQAVAWLPGAAGAAPQPADDARFSAVRRASDGGDGGNAGRASQAADVAHAAHAAQVAGTASGADASHAAHTLRTAGWRLTPDGLMAHAPPHLARLPAPAPPPRTVLVVGAGLAGAACAHALAVQGVAVTVLEAALPASGASGNPAGLVHGVVHAQDGPHAQLLRAAALHTARMWPALRAAVPGDLGGLLRLDGEDAAHLAPPASRWPAAYVQALTQAEAAVQAGTPLPRGGALYPQGGWLAPPALVAAWLATPGITLLNAKTAHALQATPNGWVALDTHGATLAHADAVVVAAGAGSLALLAPHSALGEARPGTPLLGHTRGQISWWSRSASIAAGASGESIAPHASSAPVQPCAARLPGAAPLLPVSGGAYAMISPGGGLLCGATSQRVPLAEVGQDATPRAADHAANLARSAALLGWPALTDAQHAQWAAQAQGRVAWRLHTDDRLPLAGPAPQPWPALQAAMRLTQPLRVPAVPGLYACTALGGRGLTLAALLGEVLAAQVLGLPAPLPAPLLAAISPQRWVARAASRSAAGP